MLLSFAQYSQQVHSNAIGLATNRFLNKFILLLSSRIFSEAATNKIEEASKTTNDRSKPLYPQRL